MGNLKKDIQLQIMEYLKEILSIHIMEAMDFRVIKIIITETWFQKIIKHYIISEKTTHNLIFSIIIWLIKTIKATSNKMMMTWARSQRLQETNWTNYTKAQKTTLEK